MIPKISERTLKKWRKEALKAFEGRVPDPITTMLEQIIRMTQELLDQHLIKGRR